ncbi:alpha/beta hydrolase [Paraburkholderia sp. BL10I2N1]|uniref:alpha/beta fold hydrolase n=1 Tax=Paraburkholderia sp. BL10I2N1 TaxID=1938796 RepID=UPI001FB76F42|nr:alpha/beta hydrolase [Paraburkholderia sp. BL10I2N1]
MQGVIIKGSGHWLMEEAPEQTIPAIVQFIDAPPAQQAAQEAAGTRSSDRD